MRRLPPALAACAIALTASAPARGGGASLRASLIETKLVKLDGVPREWPGELQRLGEAVKGRLGKPDLEARALIAYDESRVYVAADVSDDLLRAGHDHLELALGFPGGTVHTIALVPGDPGKSPGRVTAQGGKPVAGARVVEAPREGGYTLEASVPWSTFPEAATTRVGLRAALFVHDADGAGGVEAIAGSAPSAAYASLPPLLTEPEQALAEGLLRAKGIHSPPSCSLFADVAGDGSKERVLVYDRFLVVLGPGFLKGTRYYYADLGVSSEAGMLPVCEVRDLTGDGKAELLFHKRLGTKERYREVVEVLRFGTAEAPTSIFRHEIALANEKGSVENKLDLLPAGGKVAIRIEPGTARGFHAGNYAEPTQTAFDPLLLPWGTIKSQRYEFSGSAFTKTAEDAQPATPPPAAPPPAPTTPAKAPPAPTSAELLDRVYTAYRRDRQISGAPRFDVSVDVAGGPEAERVLVHDRDLVVFGKDYKGGTGYSFLNLAQFASPADLRDLTARDLTGDGKAELIVKGRLHQAAPKEAGGGAVEREVVLVFQVAGESLRRIFAAEVGRAIGDRKVTGEYRFVRAGQASEIELAPGRASGWTEQTYPFNQDAAPVGGFEPLLLPWGSPPRVRYRWTGSTFAR